MKENKNIPMIGRGRSGETRSNIRKYLKENPRQTLTKIANKLNLKLSSTSHILNKMIQDDEVIKIGKHFELSKQPTVPKEKQTRKQILNLLKNKNLTRDEISKILSEFKEKNIVKSIEKLEEDNYVEEYIEEKTIKVKLSAKGKKEVNLCELCNKEIPEFGFFIGNTRLEYTKSWPSPSYYITFVHPKCRSYTTYSEREIPDDALCSFCGLPLSPQLLREMECWYKIDIRPFLTQVEVEALMWGKKKKENIKGSKKLEGGKEGGWGPSDEFYPVGRYEDVKKLVDEVVENLKKMKEKAKDYDSEKRREELGRVVLDLLKIKEESFQRAVNKLMGPFGVFYGNYWPGTDYFNLVDFNLNDGFVFVKDKEEKLHPYCFLLSRKIERIGARRDEAKKGE